jgi:hypothetical protein
MKKKDRKEGTTRKHKTVTLAMLKGGRRVVHSHYHYSVQRPSPFCAEKIYCTVSSFQHSHMQKLPVLAIFWQKHTFLKVEIDFYQNHKFLNKK